MVLFFQIGASVETFLESLEPGQPILLCVGEQKNNLQRFYVIVDHKAIPCKAQTSLAAFDELFKAHFIFSVNYHESLNSFYTFIQTTVFNIDVGSTKESPRVKELRARLLNTSIWGDTHPWIQICWFVLSASYTTEVLRCFVSIWDFTMVYIQERHYVWNVDSRDVLRSFALIQGSRNTLFVGTGTLFQQVLLTIWTLK